MSNDINQNTTQNPIVVKESKFKFFYNLITTRFFIIIAGMFIGAGIVLKFNPEIKILNNKVNFLEIENSKLKEELARKSIIIKNYNGEIRNSIELPWFNLFVW